LLGTVEIRGAGGSSGVPQPSLRILLAVLALSANRVVSSGALTEALWQEEPSREREQNLHSRIYKLRRLLSAAEPGRDRPRLVTMPPGYRLELAAADLDVARFRSLAAGGRALARSGSPEQAARTLAEALGLWRGPALADVAELSPWLEPEAAALEEARLTATEDWAEAMLATGRHAELTAELSGLAGRHPLRERLRGLLMLALYRSGGQARALDCYEQGRRLLADELGVDPGPELRKLHEQILRADTGLLAPVTPEQAPQPARDRTGEHDAPTAAGSPAAVVPRELPADVAGFTGRGVELAELDLLLPAAGQQGGTAGPVVISAVSGTAGVGKTALAVRWAHRAAGAFPDGQLYVNLRGYDPDQPVLAAEALAGFLRAFGVAGPDVPLGEAERAARYRSVVAGKRLLVVLDNAATEEQVRPLLPGTSSAMVVVTSRDSLAGLVARDGARRLDLDLLPPAEAVALLDALIGGRAEADPTATEALAGLCARLPLALRVAAELAAARPDTPLTVLAGELAAEGDRLELLDAGGDPRSAVTSVFSWSYRHLPADAARMFRLLGLHPGTDWDRFAAGALTATNVTEAGRLLSVLARAHLIQPTGPARYGMHDLLRAYAVSLAAAHDDDETRHAALTGLFAYYQAAYAAAVECLAPGERHHWPDPATTDAPVPEFRDPGAARAWLDAELSSLTAVAAYTASNSWPGHAIRLAATITEAWVAPSAARPLPALLRRRVSLDQLGTELRNRIHAVAAGYSYDRSSSYQAGPDRGWLAELELPATSREIVADCLAVIDNLEPLINQLDGELHHHARADPRVKMLMSLPGVGELTALVMLTGVGDITRFGDARELAYWARLIPTVRGPDVPIGPRHIPGQSPASLRWVCCLAAQTAKRSPAFAATYAAIAGRRGKKIATVAIARKLLACVWQLLASVQAADTGTAAVSAVPLPWQP
jgi:DNA-binding SARP family transcriptional activator